MAPSKEADRVSTFSAAPTTASALVTLRPRLREYPQPVAAVFARYFTIPASHFQDRHAALSDCFETTLRFIAVVALMDAARDANVLTEAFPERLDFLKRPTLGHWLSLIRALVSVPDGPNAEWIGDIRKWYHSMVPRTLGEAFTFLPEVKGAQPVSSMADLANNLVTYRNKTRGHGARPLDSEARKRVPVLEEILGTFVGGAQFLGSMNIFCADEQKVLGRDLYQVEATSLRGIERSHREYRWTDQLEPGAIYMSAADHTELQRAPLSLSPFAEWQSVDGRDPQFFFFNEAQRTKLDYLCYVDGAHYAHRELKAQFQQFVKIDLALSARSHELLLHTYTAEERVAMSRQLENAGRELLSQSKFDGAVASFEEALDWDRRAELYVAMAEALIGANDEPEYVLRTLDSALELDPNNEPALLLRNRMMRQGLEPDAQSTAEWWTQSNRREYHLLYDAITPARFRSNGVGFWGGIAFAVYVGIPLLLRLVLGREAIHLQLLGAIFLVESALITIGLVLSHRHYVDSYFALFGQIEGSKPEEFRRFFDMQYDRMFGQFVTEGRVIRLDIRRERRFILLAGGIVMIFVAQIVWVQQLLKLSPAVAATQFLFTTLLWLSMVPPGRFICMSTLFMKAYGNTFSLSPVVAAGDSGFDRVLAIFQHNLFLVGIGWLLNWSWNLMVVRDPLYLDFLGLAFGGVYLLLWAILTPLHVLHALKLSRSKESASYRGHLRQAFQAFVKMPTDATRDRVRWLLDHVDILSAVSRRLLGVTQLAWIAMGIIELLLVGVVYVAVRLGWMPGLLSVLRPPPY